MDWRPRFHYLRHPRPSRRVKEPRCLYQASKWPTMPELFLRLAILKLGTEEQLASGAVRTRFRAKRLRAVDVFRRRFTRMPKLQEFSMRSLPRLGE